MWVPWRAGNPGQQRRRKGVMSHREAIEHARRAHRKAAFKALKRGKMTAHEYQARYGRVR